MSRRPLVLLLVATVLGLSGCSGASKSSTTSGTSTTSSTAVTTPGETGTSTTVNAPGGVTTGGPTTAPAPGATSPTTAPVPDRCAVGGQAPPSGNVAATFATALAFAPDGRLFFAERAGTVRVFQSGQSKVFATVNTVQTEPNGSYGERGLLGLAIDPNFTQNRFVYAFYSDADYTHQDVVRWTDCAGVGTAAKIIIVLPSGGDCCHKGGRLAFGRDGKLYVTLGEEHDPPVAQVTSDVRGKVLRYNSDGSVPTDNPFGSTNPVWIYGLRNPFGIAFSPSGQLAITNNGPSGDAGAPGTGYDTVIFAAPRGAGYQWPNCYGYSVLIAGHTSCGAGELGPDWSSEAAPVVPTGATFVDAAGPAGYAGKLVVCSYNKGALIFTPGVSHTAPGTGSANCQFDIKQGPDHALYFSGGSAIYRLG